MDKKITVQFKANTRLKPKSIVWNSKVQNAYPLYVTVIYDGSNTDFKAEINDEMVLVTEDLAQLEISDLKNSLLEYQAFIYEVLKTEIEAFEKDFTLSGFGNRIKVYRKDVQSIFSSKSVAELLEMIRKHLSDEKVNMPENDVFIRFMQVYDELSKFNVFNWVWGADEDAFMNYLNVQVGEKSLDGILYRFIGDAIRSVVL